MPENPLDIYYSLRPIFVISRVLGLVPFIYSKTQPNSTTRSPFQTFYNGFVFFLVLAWFISSIIFNSVYHYTKHTSMYIIPMFSKMSTIFGATLSALIVCHRGTLQHMCKKMTMIDQILSVPPDVYKRSRLVTSIEIMVVFSAACLIHVFDLQGRELGYILTIELAGWIVSSYVNNVVILQFLNCVRIIKNRFNTLNYQLSEMAVHDFEEEELLIFLSNSNALSRPFSQSTDEVCFGRGSRVSNGSLSRDTVCSRSRGRAFVYNPVKIHSLRLTHNVLYKLTRVINSDFGIQIFLEMLHSFISLIMSMYMGMTGESSQHATNCREEANCFRVVAQFCLAALCITKFVAVATFCQLASDEMARTPALVRGLLLLRPLGADSCTELQLFYKQIRDVDTEFTAFGFFSLNLKLLSSVAAAATTYIVILVQSRPVA